MRITITGINFKYDDGYRGDYTGVELQFIATGFNFTNNNPVEITKEQYKQNEGNTNGLRALIVDKKLVEADEYINSLNDYKASLNAE